MNLAISLVYILKFWVNRRICTVFSLCSNILFELSVVWFSVFKLINHFVFHDCRFIYVLCDLAAVRAVVGVWGGVAKAVVVGRARVEAVAVEVEGEVAVAEAAAAARGKRIQLISQLMILTKNWIIIMLKPCRFSWISSCLNWNSILVCVSSKLYKYCNTFVVFSPCWFFFFMHLPVSFYS